MGSQDAPDYQGSGNTHSPGRLTPRIEHFDGEVPPALSPLDAFALQSRLLSKQFEESRKAGRRLSRLPPSSVERSFSQPRPGYFRSQSGESQRMPRSPDPHDQGHNYEVEEPSFRPKSQHPHLSGASKSGVNTPTSFDNEPSVPPLPTHGFGAPLMESPEESPASHRSDAESNQPVQKQPQNQQQQQQQQQQRPIGIGVLGLHKTPSQESSKSSTRYYASKTLAPPSGPGPTSSPALPQPESSDDDYYASSNAGSTFSKPRKLSSSSGMSMPPQSPMSHLNRAPPRSPSPASDIIAAPAQGLPRPAFNFSRPFSRSSTSLSLPSPQIGAPREPNLVEPPRGRRPSPIQVPQPQGPTEEGEAEDAQLSTSNSYIYAKYALPRGRAVSRDSLVFSGLQTPHFEWNEPLFESSPPPSATKPKERPARTPSPVPQPEAPRASESPVPSPAPASAKSSPAKLKKKKDRSPAASSRFSSESARGGKLSAPKDTPRKQDIPSDRLSVRSQPSDKDDDARTSSGNSASTIRPTSARVESETSKQLTPDDHVDMGIACHENGSLKESTYHLRLAAMQNHPTGMLLYALSCRHGWGMRSNQKEGVQWLRKAVDSSGLDANSADNAIDDARGRNYQEQKARQAQFALGIYELGVSHLNGWGIEQDKALALRCFEIAGRWGDADALAEAGFCYAEGVGTKKDFKKAAKYYRMAESKGMSMVGNSWIYKDKYKSDDEETNPRTPRPKSAASTGKKSRNKSRTRSIFARKKSNVDDDA